MVSPDSHLDGQVDVVEELEVRLLCSCLNHSVGEVHCTCTSQTVVVADDGRGGTCLHGCSANNLELGGGVGGKLVHGDDDGHAELLGVGDVPARFRCGEGKQGSICWFVAVSSVSKKPDQKTQGTPEILDRQPSSPQPTAALRLHM